MKSLFRTFVVSLEKSLPSPLFRLLYGCYANLKNPFQQLVGYGLWRTCFTHRSENRYRDPIPWFSYPAVEYLDGLDFSECAVFEFGSANSTLYWANRAKSVIAIEHDPAWANHLQPLLPSNATVRQVDCLDFYASAVTVTDRRYDIIIIDGAVRHDCAQTAIGKLNPGGFIILDDADDHPNAAETLRAADLIEVDFAGFSPIVSYTKTTSFFLHPGFRPVARFQHMPHHSTCHPKANAP